MSYSSRPQDSEKQRQLSSPIFHNFLKKAEEKPNEKNTGISILYITPLRALNRDMLQRTVTWGKQLGINVAVRHGDTPQSERAHQSKNPPDMLITTPETFQILFIGKKLRHHLKTVQWVVIDEVHELAGDERGAQLAVALERLYELVREQESDFQRVGLSATVGSPNEVARYLGGVTNGLFRDVVILEVDVTKHIEITVELPTITHHDSQLAQRFSMEPISFASLRRCTELINEHVSTLLFINTRDGAEILASRLHLWKEDMPVGVHHGSLSKNARIEAENEFKNGKLKGLICTSSLELGIDVGNTDFVIQYNSPRDVTRIVQRVGRSGHRVGKTSTGMIIATNPEDVAESMVIARRALTGELEELDVRQNPLSVLSNQIISLILEYGEIDAKKMFNLITRAYPFHTLSQELFNRLIQQLQNQYIFTVKEDKPIILVKRRRSRDYFIDNISMIPDEKSYMVIDASSRTKIGKLDESFVLSSGFEGTKFILRGRPWIIVKRDEDSILVSPIKELGTVPSWVGEDIPIPFEVAQEVGRIRRFVSEKKPYDQYPCDEKTFTAFLQQITNQERQGFLVPHDSLLTVETEGKTVVINACFGTKVNESLGRLISAILVQSLGESVGVTSDAYRITLELPGRVPADRIVDILMKTNPESLEYLLTTILRNSSSLRWQLVHVARKFGILRKDFDYRFIGMRKLFTLFEHSLVFEEALDKLLWERMDIKRTQQVLRDIQSGRITVQQQRLSPLALAGYETIRGLMLPERADRTILNALKRRLEENDITFLCTNCKHTWNTSVGRTPSQPSCPQCQAIRIAVIPRRQHALIKLYKKKAKTKEDQKEIARLHKNASLILSHGVFAVYTIMGRGIGPDTAARILRRYTKRDLEQSDETLMKLLKDILKAELTYARTRGFWDNS
ncbi:MAG: DEAD/DEAH box helicase [Methanobacteriota archaeon]